jgi:hypothetical protein
MIRKAVRRSRYSTSSEAVNLRVGPLIPPVES